LATAGRTPAIQPREEQQTHKLEDIRNIQDSGARTTIPLPPPDKPPDFSTGRSRDSEKATPVRRQRYLRVLDRITAILLYLFRFYRTLTDNLPAPAPVLLRASLVPSLVLPYFSSISSPRYLFLLSYSLVLALLNIFVCAYFASFYLTPLHTYHILSCSLISLGVLTFGPDLLGLLVTLTDNSLSQNK